MSNNKRYGMKTQIAIMRTEQKGIVKTLEKIEKNTEDLPVLRTDVSWLKNWHNKIVLGVLAAVILTGTLGILKLLGK